MKLTEKQYQNRLKILLSNPNICKENKDLFKKFFQEQEYKLKRINSLSALDKGTIQTLLGYINNFQNVNKWFNNKPWKSLTRSDIKRVYDDLEDGKIKNSLGRPFQDKISYYNKVFKSRPFQMVGKDSIAKEVIRYSNGNNTSQVKFFRFETFEKLLSVTTKLEYKTLMWLSWDVGENINSLLQLRKKDFTLRYDKERDTREYHVNLYQNILKRSRLARGELTLYPETVRLLDMVLKDKQEEDLVFPLDYGAVRMFLNRTVKKIKAVCEPTGSPITWKDFRSSMATHLLMNNWTRDEVNARLGHKPSSDVIDRYINYLALDRDKPKERMHNNSMQELKTQLDAMQRKDKRNNEELQETKELINKLLNVLEKEKGFKELKTNLLKTKKEVNL